MYYDKSVAYYVVTLFNRFDCLSFRLVKRMYTDVLKDGRSGETIN
jgi:hypothetical protein